MLLAFLLAQTWGCNLLPRISVLVYRGCSNVVMIVYCVNTAHTSYPSYSKCITWNKPTEKQEVTFLILLIMPVTFVTIWPSNLTGQLVCPLGIRDTALKWTESYHTCRRQAVLNHTVLTPSYQTKQPFL